MVSSIQSTSSHLLHLYMIIKFSSVTTYRPYLTPCLTHTSLLLKHNAVSSPIIPHPCFHSPSAVPFVTMQRVRYAYVTWALGKEYNSNSRNLVLHILPSHHALTLFSPHHSTLISVFLIYSKFYLFFYFLLTSMFHLFPSTLLPFLAILSLYPPHESPKRRFNSNFAYEEQQRSNMLEIAVPKRRAVAWWLVYL